MRKLIIDGSVTSGFQRTAILGFAGSLKTSFGTVEIEGINLEEDSARPISREHGHTIYNLDRQGIPLIEITTGPQIHLPNQAYETAKQIGNILRSFKETRRGLGTIRQDLNVSIKGGARIEIKGAQNLKLFPQVVENEVKRQIVHISILEELKSRKINLQNFSDKEIYDISPIFKSTKSQIILDNLKEEKTSVLAIKLNNFKNILKTNMQENYRFATEISNRNKSLYPQIKGLFHSDELPNYGITQAEVDKIRKELKLNETDSFILLAGKTSLIKNSLNHIFEIIEELITSVPTEVRDVDPKGVKTKFLRPMPGSARMYPETDVPQIELTSKFLKEQQKLIPELYDKRLERLTKELKLEENKVISLIEKFSEDQIKKLIKASNKTASSLYSILFEIPKDIKKRDNIEPIDFKFSLLEDLLKQADKNNFNQNIIRDIFVSLYKDKLDEVENLKKYLDEKSLISAQVDEKEVELKIKEIISQNSNAPFGALMGLCMKAFNGKVDGKTVSQILKKLQ